MALFIENQFPTDISYGATGGPQYSTDIVTTFAGHEQRNSNWQHPIAKYNISSGVKSEEQWKKLIHFFRICRGRALGFRYKDWSDYEGNNELIAIADGKQTSFQLIKHYAVGNISIKRTIHKPVKDATTIYSNSIIIKPQYIDTTTGEFTLQAPPDKGHTITADFEFDVPVRFDTDEMHLAVNSLDAASWSNIPLVEIRL